MNSHNKIDLEHIGFIILSFFPLYPYFGISLAIAFFSIFSIIDAFRFRKKKHTNSFKFLLIQISFFLILLITAIYHNEFLASLQYLDASYVLVIMPAVLFINQNSISTKKRTLYLNIFTISSLLLGIYIFIFSLIFSIKNNTNFDFLYEEISLSTIHPNYTSLFFLASILYLVYDYKATSKLQKVIKILLIIIFISFIVGFASRIFITCLFIIGVNLFFNEKIVNKKMAIAIVIILISTSFMYKPLQKKAKEFFNVVNVGLPNQKFPTSAQVRVGIYNCTLPQLKDNYLLGNGIITFENNLNQCYEKFNNFEKKRYNTHNYYLFLLGSGGVFALIFFLILLYTLIKKSFIYSDLLNTFIFLFLAITLLTENTLSRVLGALFFMFFVLIFVKSNNSKPNFYEK